MDFGEVEKLIRPGYNKWKKIPWKSRMDFSFFKLTCNFIYLAMRTPGGVNPVYLCNKRMAAWITRCSSPLDPGETGWCGHTQRKIEHMDRNQAYMMVANSHVATVPPLFRSAHAAVHVQGVGQCNLLQFLQMRKRLTFFSACDTTQSFYHRFCVSLLRLL